MAEQLDDLLNPLMDVAEGLLHGIHLPASLGLGELDLPESAALVTLSLASRHEHVLLSPQERMDE